MIIHIHNNLTIGEIQERFNKCFPCLQIEFFSKPHQFRELSADKDKYKPDELVSNILKNYEQGELELKSWEKAYEVEKAFKEKFGLNVQILRNFNGKWLQTSETDKYTLAQLNDMSQPVASEKIINEENPNELFENE